MKITPSLKPNLKFPFGKVDEKRKSLFASEEKRFFEYRFFVVRDRKRRRVCAKNRGKKRTGTVKLEGVSKWKSCRGREEKERKRGKEEERAGLKALSVQKR